MLAVSFDADYYVPEMETLTPLTDIFIGSEYYYRALFGDAAEDSAMLRNLQGLRERGPRMVGFTFGARGCVLLQGDSLLKIPAYSVEVRDTTGAGDTFHGAFLYGVLQGWSAENCARFASAAAAIQCTCLGGRAGLPTAAMVERLMQAGEIDPSQLQERQRWYEEQETMA